MSEPAATSPAPVAEAESIGRGGPIELSLRLHKKSIKAGAESLWYQVGVRNVGDASIVLVDPPFLRPSPLEVYSGGGLVLWVTGPDGKAVKRRLIPSRDGALAPGAPSWPTREGDGLDEAQKKKAVADVLVDRDILRRRTEMEDALARRGVTRDEIIKRSIEYDEKHPLSTSKGEAPVQAITLKPGEIAMSRPWSADRRPPGVPAVFSEFFGYSVEAPGRYEMKAILDGRSSDITVKLHKKYGVPERPEAIRVETQPIVFEVLR